MDLNKLHHCWFALQVKPRHEFVTARLLKSKGCDEFVPSYRLRRNWTDRIKEVDVPLFTGYVFCRFDAQVRWPILSTQGVIRVVGNSHGPQPIPDHEIESIRTVMTSGLNPRPCEYLKAGDRVRIARGPLSGVEGTMICMHNRRQLILSVELVQGSVVVDVDQCSMIHGTPILVSGTDYIGVDLAQGG
jgi:transcription antitermination factor NusG